MILVHRSPRVKLRVMRAGDEGKATAVAFHEMDWPPDVFRLARSFNEIGDWIRRMTIRYPDDRFTLVIEVN